MTQFFKCEKEKILIIHPDSVVVFCMDNDFCMVVGPADCAVVSTALNVGTCNDGDGDFYISFRLADGMLSKIACIRSVAFCKRGEPNCAGLCYTRL